MKNKNIVIINPINHTNMVDFIVELSKKHIVEVYSYENNILIKNNPNVKYYKLKHFSLSKSQNISFQHIPSFFQLWKIISKDKVITVKTLGKFETLFTLFISRLKGVQPIVFIQNIYDNRKTFFGKAHYFLFKFLFPLKNVKLVSMTKIGYEVAKRKSKFPYYLPFGIKVKKNIKKIGHKTTNLVCVSKFQKRKNIYEVVKLFHKLYEIDSNLRLTIASIWIIDKDYHKKIVNYIKKFKLNKVISIKIGLNSKQMENLYLKSDAYLLLSSAESAVYSHLEAMNYELPVLLTHDNGTSNYIDDGVEGKIVNISNWDTAYDEISHFLESKNLSKVGKLAKKRLNKDYDVKKVVEKFEKII